MSNFHVYTEASQHMSILKIGNSNLEFLSSSCQGRRKAGAIAHSGGGGNHLRVYRVYFFLLSLDEEALAFKSAKYSTIPSVIALDKVF